MANGLPRDGNNKLSQVSATQLVKAKSVTVGTSAVEVTFGANSERIFVVLQHLNASGDIYVGGSDVTSAKGIKIAQNVINSITLTKGAVLYAISTVAGQDLRVMECI